METENIINAIKKEIGSANEIFFEQIWREKIDNMLTIESRYSQLVKWCEDKIDSTKDIFCIFNPADKNNNYTNNYFATYKEQLGEFAMLIQFREMLLDNRCSETQRENIEYTICKIFNIKWCEQLKLYV